MVNFHDSAIETTDTFVLLKFWHVIDGLFIWEFFTTLDFEWSIIQGRRRYRWTIWVYFLVRVAALVAVIDNLILFNLNAPVLCQYIVPLAWLPLCLALAATSLLLVLRVVAIWNRNRVVVIGAIIVWAISNALIIQGVSRIRYARNISGACEPVNIQVFKLPTIVGFVTGILFLVTMLVGLFRLGCHRHGAFVTGRFLWNQGVISLFLATIVGVLPTLFICLDLNASLSVIFHLPWAITLSIAATRMYRGLDDFLSSDCQHVPSNNDNRTISISRARGTPVVPVPLNGIEMEVDTDNNDSLTSQAIRYSLGSNVDKELHDEPRELV